MGIAHYLWRAFTSRWNLLIVFGSSAAAMLSPWPDVLLPLIGAGEAIYLGGLVSLPRFRQAIDAQDADRVRGLSRANAPSASLLIAGLRAEAQKRFNDLRTRCLEMRSIARAAAAGWGRPHRRLDALARSPFIRISATAQPAEHAAALSSLHEHRRAHQAPGGSQDTPG